MSKRKICKRCKTEYQEDTGYPVCDYCLRLLDNWEWNFKFLIHASNLVGNKRTKGSQKGWGGSKCRTMLKPKLPS